jgi:hypothetical protein
MTSRRIGEFDNSSVNEVHLWEVTYSYRVARFDRGEVLRMRNYVVSWIQASFAGPTVDGTDSSISI